jgi:putative superfamily III holin-X
LPGSDGRPDNLATAVTEVSERLTVIVRDEIELFRVELTAKLTTMARGVAAIALGAVFGVFAIVFILLTIAWGLNSALSSLWVGFAIVMVLLILLTIGAFLFARSKLGAGGPAPTMAIDEAKKIRATVAAGTELEP